MNPEDVPMGYRILPGERCERCGARIEVYGEAGDIMWLSCPNFGDGADHTDHNGIERSTLEAWGWEFNED